MSDVVVYPRLTDAQREQYLSGGGTPHLDNEHTVFGRVVNGLEVVADLRDWTAMPAIVR